MENRKTTEVVTITRINKLSLNENACDKIFTVLKQKLQLKNSAFLYQFVYLFNLSRLRNSTLSFIQRCFTIVSDNESFLELDYNSISKILASSELLITSEVEVFKVTKRWLNYNIEERSKNAKDLYLKARLHLLSAETIRRLLNDENFFEKGDCCAEILNQMLDCKEKKIFKFSSNYHTIRYCNQKYFKQLVLGGYNSTTSMTCNNVSCIDVNKLEDVEAFPPMITGRSFFEVVYLKGFIYAFGGWNINNDWIKSVDKYSLTSETWSQVAEMNDYRKHFCVCAFIDKVFIIGGSKDRVRTNSCLQFNTSDYSCKKVANINEARSIAACAVFKERIIVSGGWSNNGDDLNTVESYDVLPDKWSTMPNMNSGKVDHSLIVVKNKLFVISKSKDDWEVFDNMCKKFVTIKSPEFFCFPSKRAFSIENKIFVFNYKFTKIISYDTYINEWSEDNLFFEFTKNLQYFSSVKVPCF